MESDLLVKSELEILESRIMELKIAGYRINEQLQAQYEILKAEYQELNSH